MKVVEKQVKSSQFNRDGHNEQLKIDQFRISNSIKEKLFLRDIYILKKKKKIFSLFFLNIPSSIKIRKRNIKVGVIQNVFVHVKEKKRRRKI